MGNTADAKEALRSATSRDEGLAKYAENDLEVSKIK